MVTVAIAAMLPAAPARANQCGTVAECTTTYYQNGSYTTVVGQYFQYCDGTSDSWGYTSGWYRLVWDYCN
jgi:hypothetical protein